MDVLKFQSPTSIAIFAPEFSGKSTLMRRILENADTMFVEHPEYVVYCYKEWLPMFVDMKDSVKELIYIKVSHQERRWKNGPKEDILS